MGPQSCDDGVDPTSEAERGDALALALRVRTERLAPAERAAYVLRVAFDYPYRRIPEALALSEPNARQLVARARGHLAEESRRTLSAEEHRVLLDAVHHRRPANARAGWPTGTAAPVPDAQAA